MAILGLVMRVLDIGLLPPNGWHERWRPMMPRRTQQLGGLLIALLGAGFTAWSWYTALTRGYFYRHASLLFPAFFVLGVGLLIFPGHREERIARGEDISGLQGWKLITPRWWAMLVVALVAAVVNTLVLLAL
jgi:hypothetical protein